MKNNASRRTFLQGLMSWAVVIGFDYISRSWVTSANAASGFEELPPLDGVLEDGFHHLAEDDGFLPSHDSGHHRASLGRMGTLLRV